MRAGNKTNQRDVSSVQIRTYSFNGMFTTRSGLHWNGHQSFSKSLLCDAAIPSKHDIIETLVVILTRFDWKLTFSLPLFIIHSFTRISISVLMLNWIQNISPGLVENDILTTNGTDDNELVKYMPRLKPEDVAQAVIFAITAPQHVLVSIMTIRHSLAPS